MAKRKREEISSGLSFFTSDKTQKQENTKATSQESFVRMTFELPVSVVELFESRLTTLDPRKKKGTAPKLRRRDLASAALKRGLEDQEALRKELQG